MIVHFFLFEHIRNPFKFMSDCMNLLNENGIIAEIPNASDPLTSIYKIDAFEKFLLVYCSSLLLHKAFSKLYFRQNGL